MRFKNVACVLSASCLLVGCGRAAPVAAVTPSRAEASGIAIVASFDLPQDDVRSRELSGIAWDQAAGILFAVSDTVPIIVPLRPTPDYAQWTFGEPTALKVRDVWDGEGIAITPGGFLVANERGPHIYFFDRGGNQTAEVPLPPYLAACVANKALESLSVSPDGRFLFTANESTLLVDEPQPTPTEGALVRILRRDLKTGDEVAYAYRTDPIFARRAGSDAGSDMGVSDVLALSAREVLVMERSYVPGVGNSVRIYRSTLGGANVIDAPSLPRATEVMPKTLFVDFATLPGAEIAGRGPHHLPNYEGLALGPTLADGRRVLFVISDDNANPALVARVLVLALRDAL